MTDRKVSHAQNAEDVRVWRAFEDLPADSLTYVDVGANEPRHLSITASLHDLGWRGLLIEADPQLAADLRVHRPGDTVVQIAAAAASGELTFYRVPGTGLGTLDAAEARAAAERGFPVEEVVVRTERLDTILDGQGLGEVHFMSIDVEGAESAVLEGLSLTRHRPWVMCIEAVLPGTSTPSHEAWDGHLRGSGYRDVAFDGVNRWYVAEEHADRAAAVAIPYNAIDAGAHGWVTADLAERSERVARAEVRRAWQRELILNDIQAEVPRAEYERQIEELRSALIEVEGSRAFHVSRRVARVGKGALFRIRNLVRHLPGGAQRRLIRARHLRHVTVNMGHLTDPAFLGTPPGDEDGWITPAGLPPAPTAGWDLASFSDANAARTWLASGPFDTDALLDRRMDNHGDELGRVAAAFRLRLALADSPPKRHWAGGNRVLFDARCLQSAAFGARGIGRFAKAALTGARGEIGDDRLVLLVDHGLEPLPHELAGDCLQVTRVDERTVPTFGVLIQPSPMTASSAPLLPLLHSTAYKLAVVFDFIPMHYPTVYLGHAAARAEYAAALDALRLFDDFVCISHLVRSELAEVLGRSLTGHGALDPAVAWPRDVLSRDESPASSTGHGPIVVMTGDDGRKNTFGALAAIGAATAGDEQPRDVVVIGMAGQETRVHHWSIAAAMRPGEARTVGAVSDEEMGDLLAGASLVMVMSFDEGLSLPVIEALRSGTPVVASDIPAHRELIGTGSYLADPRSPKAMERAVRRHSRRDATRARQWERLAAHQHSSLEAVIGRKLSDRAAPTSVGLPSAAVYVGGRPLNVGVATPWSPQRSGVADYSVATITELARLCDVTVYTTHDASVEATAPESVRIRQAPVADLLEAAPGHDAFVSVVGNSHFHLPYVDLADTVVIAHDTRMVEYYMSLRGKGGVEQVMLRGTGRRALVPPLDDQVDDMRLLQDAGLWEIARRARLLVMHTPSASATIAAQTGVTPRLLPFANYRAPAAGEVTDLMRAEARDRLGFAQQSHGTVHLGSFGYIDVRTKMTDVVIESAAWLSQWGHRVSLHLVGAASPAVEAELMQRAREAGIANVEITGYVDEATFRDYLLAVDLGLQLRISPLLGVSGPLSDLAAYGTPGLASAGLVVDVDAPSFIRRLPDDVSPVLVAEAIEDCLAAPVPIAEREEMRREYLALKSPTRYAEALLDLLVESARSPVRGEG